MSKLESRKPSSANLLNDDVIQSAQTQLTSGSQVNQTQKITLDQIASSLLKQNFILTALELHTELAELGREIPRLRDYFSNPANFEQQASSQSNSNGASSSGFFPLHRASSIQTFDSLDLTRYSDDIDQNKFQDDRIAVLEFELRKAKETISQLRNTLTLATESNMNSDSRTNINEQDQKSSDFINEKFYSNSLINKTSTKSFYHSQSITPDENEDHELNELDTLSKETNKSLMPHDKNAINFLINEYLLEQNYKMTSVTFSEENESQDLEDWDVVGLNRSKPPNLSQLYKFYLLKKNQNSRDGSTARSKVKYTDSATQTDDLEEEKIEIEYVTTSTNTNVIETKTAETVVNFDRDTFDNQRTQITKLLEKQEILLKSISNLEKEINKLNSERENNLKKIELLTLSLENANQNNELKKNESTIELTEFTRLPESTSTEEIQADNPIQQAIIESTNDRKIPIVFKDTLCKSVGFKFTPQNQSLIEEMSKVKSGYDYLKELLFKYLEIIVPNINIENRLDVLPILLTTAILEQEQIASNPTVVKELKMLKQMFNLIETPDREQRLMILNACIEFSRYVGPTVVNNHLLPQCWEQLDNKYDERRMLVAEACALLAPHIYNDMRSSLMFSILKQLIEQDKSDMVRVCAANSLSILINYIKDEHKFNQCIELLDLCATDSCDLVVKQVEQLMMPSISLWSLNMDKFNGNLIMHLLEKAEHHIIAYNKQKYINNSGYKKSETMDSIALDHEICASNYINLVCLNLQYIFAFILINFRNNTSNAANGLDENGCERDDFHEQVSELNSYFHLLQEKLEVDYELYKIDSILDDYLLLTKKYLDLIETDSWSSIELSNAFTWLTDEFVRKLIQLSTQVDAKDRLCHLFVKLFRNFILLFAIDYELIKSKIIPIFEKLLNIIPNDSETTQQNSIEQILNNKALSCPLFKATLPVYFVGILSTLVDVETCGWPDLNSSLGNKSLNSSSTEQDKQTSLSLDDPTLTSCNKKSIEKRINYMNDYLKNIFFTLSLNQCNLDGLVVIYEQMKIKSKPSDYIIQMLLSTLWDGIVHVSLYVRCNTAKLFEILVKDCDDYLLSTRILPALITLANDLDKMVRCSSLSPLTSIIENCTNKEILERVYTQLQSFLSDPILKDEYLLQIELLKAFRRISTKVNSKFREEFILPYLTILTMQIKNVINENDYEFSISALTASFLSISSGNSALSSSNLFKENSNQSSMSSSTNIQSHQQDIQKICMLLFDIYQILCQSTNTSNINHIYISKQSIHESLLPGLNCLRDIFHNKIIHNSSSGQTSQNPNDYVQHLDTLIHKFELIHQQINSQQHNDSGSFSSPILNTLNFSSALISNYISPQTQNTDANMNMSPMKVSPSTLSNSTIVPESAGLSSASNSSISSLNNGPKTQNGSINNMNTQDNNFKSLVFKGITNFKDHKDKFNSFLLTNKTFKK